MGTRWTEEDECMTNKWYKLNEAGYDSYTPVVQKKGSMVYLGDGETKPTPKMYTEFNNSSKDNYVDGELCYTSLETESMDSLPLGSYRFRGVYDGYQVEKLTKAPIRHDKCIDLGGVADRTNKEIQEFLNNKEIYDNIGSQYKFGVLLYGPPGNGKTSLIRRIITDLGKDALVIFMGEFPTASFFNKLNEATKDVLKVFVFEELATTLSNSRTLVQMLDFLDGETSCDNCIVIATTNFPEEIPINMADRPSRFDKVIKFDNPNPTERRLLISGFLNRDAADKEITESEGMSVAYLKEACIESLKTKISLLDSLTSLKKRSTDCKSGFQDRKSVTGFRI